MGPVQVTTVDVELAQNGFSDPNTTATTTTTTTNGQVTLGRVVLYFSSFVQSWRQRSASGEERPPRPSRVDTMFEKANFRPGYPIYSSILGHQSEFQTFRRFRTLRMRILLIKQDQICRLEEELNNLDRREEKAMYLGSCRRDMNGKRLDVLEKLDKAFSVYDGFLQRTQWALNQPEPVGQALKSQETMVSSAGYIMRKETAYLGLGERELLNIGLVKDRGMVSVAHVIEAIVGSFYRARHKLFPHKSSGSVDDDPITISNPLIRGISRAVAASFAIILLLVPIVILNAVIRTLTRFFIVFISATLSFPSLPFRAKSA